MSKDWGTISAAAGITGMICGLAWGPPALLGTFGQEAEPEGALLVLGPSICLNPDLSTLLRCLHWEPFDSGDRVLELSVFDFM